MNRYFTVALLVLLGLGGLFFVLRPNPSVPDGFAAGAPRERTFDLAIEDGARTPEEVGEGDRVTLRLTSKAPLEVHLHGYDLEREVSPGEAATLSFEAELTGRFEIEDHESGAVLGVLLVRPR